MSVEAKGHRKAKPRTFAVGEDGGDLGVIRLEVAKSILGIVQDSEGTVPGAVVETVWANDYYRTMSNEDGEFTIERVPEGLPSIPLRVTHGTKGAYYDGQVRIIGRGDVVVNLPVWLECTLNVVDGATGETVARACSVEFILPDGERLLHQLRGPVGVDTSGRYVEVDHVPSYVFGLRVGAPGYSSETVPISDIRRVAGAPLAVRLTQRGVVKCRVIDSSTGEVLNGATLLIASRATADRNARFNYRLSHARYMAEQGVYEVDYSEFSFSSEVDEFIRVERRGYRTSEDDCVISCGTIVGGGVIIVAMERQ